MKPFKSLGLFALLLFWIFPAYGESFSIAKATVGFLKDLVEAPPVDPLEKNQVPTCELDRALSLPPVFIIGEVHNNRDSLQLRKDLFQSAVRGEIVLGSELRIQNSFKPWARAAATRDYSGKMEESLVFGIESPIPYALTVSYLAQSQMIRNLDFTVNSLYLMIVEIHENGLVANAYEKVRTEILVRGSVAQKKLVRNIDQILAPLDLDSTEVEMMDSFERYIGKHQIEDYQTLISSVHIQVIDLVNSKFSDRFGGLKFEPLLTLYDAWRIGFTDWEWRAGSIMNRIALDIRNRDFAHAMVEIICNQGGRNKPIYFIMGKAHVPGVMERLKAYTSKANQFQIYFSDYRPDYIFAQQSLSFSAGPHKSSE